MDKPMYLFLDIDGVLNTKRDWKTPYSLNKMCVEAFRSYLVSLGSRYAVRIILTSSWKAGFDFAGHHSRQIAAVIDAISGTGAKILGKTEDINPNNRSLEINSFIKAHKLERAVCYVIDDDKSLFRDKLADNARLILTDCRTGFVKKVAE